MAAKDLLVTLVFASSIVTAVWFYSLRRRMARILQWPQVRAQVLAGSIAFLPCRGSLGSLLHPDAFLPTARFTYVLEDQQFEGDRFLPVGWTVRAKETVAMGREIETFSQVFYNAAHPAEAYLEIPNRFRHGSISWETVGLVVSLISVAGFGAALL